MAKFHFRTHSNNIDEFCMSQPPNLPTFHPLTLNSKYGICFMTLELDQDLTIDPPKKCSTTQKFQLTKRSKVYIRTTLHYFYPASTVKLLKLLATQ